MLCTLPEQPRSSIFVGAGHGFKFASLGSKILSELAVYGKSVYPMETFRVNPQALTDLAHEPAFAT